MSGEDCWEERAWRWEGFRRWPNPRFETKGFAEKLIFMTGSAHLEVILYFACVIAEIFSLLYSERSTFLPNPRFRKTSFLSLSYFDFTRTVLKPRFWPSLNKVQGPGAGAVQGESLSPSLSGDERPHRTRVRPALTLSFSSSLQPDRQLVFCPLGALCRVEETALPLRGLLETHLGRKPQTPTL